jgi:hypothetical protein
MRKALLLSILLILLTGCVSVNLPQPSVSAGSSKLIVFTRGADGLLYYKRYQNGNWTNWQWMKPPPNVMVTGEISVVGQDNGQTDLFVRGGDNALWHRTWRAGSWTDWESLGGVLTSGPAAAVEK